jgi:3-methyladenine DNA glycosylase AlkD
MEKSSSHLKQLRLELKRLAAPEKAKSSAWFFKTGPGEYAEGDQFLGITVPELRTIARSYKAIPHEDILLLLRSPLHEERLLALFLLIQQFKASEGEAQRKIYHDYLAHTEHVNNWDLVDTSAAHIVGAYLATQSSAVIEKTLRTLAASDSLWERRIAMVATFYWIKRGESGYTFLIAKKLLTDRQDLIQKAVGWMLREVGKHCSQELLRTFLDEHIAHMGRTTLRYAIEHFPEPLRQTYLKK